jgi:heptaprenyl diphosphate synthase
MGILIAVGASLYFLESQVFFPVPVPGARWGFSNLVVLISAVNMGLYETLTVSLGKSFVGGLLSGKFGNIGFVIGLSGSICAGFVMWGMNKIFKNKAGYLGISSSGAFFNNLTQIILISIVLRNKLVFYYLPYMFFLGLISAGVNAFISANLDRRLKKS